MKQEKAKNLDIFDHQLITITITIIIIKIIIILILIIVILIAGIGSVQFIPLPYHWNGDVLTLRNPGW